MDGQKILTRRISVVRGTYRNADELRRALKSGQWVVGADADELLEQIDFAAGQVEAELAVVEDRQLGCICRHSTSCLGRPYRSRELLDRAAERGFSPCVLEDAALVCLQYADQPEGEMLIVGMNPVKTSDGEKRSFRIHRDGGKRWLSAFQDNLDSLWRPGHLWLLEEKPR